HQARVRAISTSARVPTRKRQSRWCGPRTSNPVGAVATRLRRVRFPSASAYQTAAPSPEDAPQCTAQPGSHRRTFPIAWEPILESREIPPNDGSWVVVTVAIINSPRAGHDTALDVYVDFLREDGSEAHMHVMQHFASGNAERATKPLCEQ